MDAALAAGAVRFDGSFDEYSLRTGGNRALPVLAVCPWCRALLPPSRRPLASELAHYTPQALSERRQLRRIRGFVSQHRRPFDRQLRAGHLTGSALVVDASGQRVLLVLHQRFERWLQPGGHGEPGETTGGEVALREAREETGIADLRLHPTAPRPIDIDIHPIPARGREPAHNHLDLRYLVVAAAGAMPNPARGGQAARWFTWDDAVRLDLDASLRRLIARARAHLEA